MLRLAREIVEAAALAGSASYRTGADGGPGRPIGQGGVGYSCLAEVRVVETILQGEAKTPFLKAGDRVSIRVEDDQGRAVFGTIEQVVEQA